MVGRQHKIVSKEEFDAKAAEFQKGSSGYVHVFETPSDDQKAVDELLGIKEGTLPPFICRFAKGNESCAGCGRHYSILDFIKSGLQVHNKEFMVKAAFGELGGYIISDEGSIQNCANCGQVGYGGCYQNRWYNACYDPPRSDDN